MPVVSVIVPVHNREDLLPQTLDSVRAQTFTDWECVIVDDHSTDGSLVVAESYASKDKRFRAVPLPDPRRYGNAARNYGLEISRGEYVNFLDSDDLFNHHKLEKQLNEFDIDPSFDMISCRHIPFREYLGDITEQFKFAPSDSWLDLIFYNDKLTGGLWGTACALWRKNALQIIGGWDEQLIIWQDPELNLRALLASLKIKRLEQILVYYRAGIDGNLGATKLGKNFEPFINSLLKAQQHLINTGNMTYIRQSSIVDRLCTTVMQRSDKTGIYSGIVEWLSLRKKFRIPMIRLILGLVLIILRRVGITRLNQKIYAQFTAYRKYLPHALPDSLIPPDEIFQ